MTAHGLMVHHLHGPGAEHPIVQGSLSADDLARILDATPHLVDAGTWLGRALVGALTDEVVVCFDDGLACQYAVALPVLRARNLTALWFVYTQQPNALEVDRWTRTVGWDSLTAYYAAFFTRAAKHVPIASAVREAATYLPAHTYLSDEDRLFRWYRDIGLSPDQYRELADDLRQVVCRQPLEWFMRLWMSPPDWRALADAGHIIGLHSHTHPTARRGVHWWREYLENARHLSAALGPHWHPQVAAHPCNLSTPEGDAALRAIGVTIGFDATLHAGGDGLHYPREDSADAKRRVLTQRTINWIEMGDPEKGVAP